MFRFLILGILMISSLAASNGEVRIFLDPSTSSEVANNIANECMRKLSINSDELSAEELQERIAIVLKNAKKLLKIVRKNKKNNEITNDLNKIIEACYILRKRYKAFAKNPDLSDQHRREALYGGGLGAKKMSDILIKIAEATKAAANTSIQKDNKNGEEVEEVKEKKNEKEKESKSDKEEKIGKVEAKKEEDKEEEEEEEGEEEEEDKKEEEEEGEEEEEEEGEEEEEDKKEEEDKEEEEEAEEEEDKEEGKKEKDKEEEEGEEKEEEKGKKEEEQEEEEEEEEEDKEEVEEEEENNNNDDE